jgi:hypothetical protein
VHQFMSAHPIVTQHHFNYNAMQRLTIEHGTRTQRQDVITVESWCSTQRDPHMPCGLQAGQHTCLKASKK